MIFFRLRDTATDETYEFKSDSRHVVVWERTSRSGETFVKLIAEMNMIALYRLAHISARQLDLPVPKDLKDFEQGWVLDLTNEDAAVPTRGAATTAT